MIRTSLLWRFLTLVFTRGLSILLAGLVFSAAIAKTARAAAPTALPPAIATAISAAYSNQCSMLKNTDIDGYSKTLTDRWVESEPNGTKTTKAQAIGAIKQQIAMLGLTVTDCAATISGGTVSPDGNTVTVNVEQSADGTVAAQNGTSPIQISARETDVWVKRGATWLQSSSTVLKNTIMVNGQVLQQNGSR
ncbi:MAG: nuclear transport factor 2 family protein [Candidatus Baltobacteraceae bacterium]